MGKRILIIEPSRTIRLLLDITLRNAGHEVAAFDEPLAAFHFLLHESKQAPDIAFVAIHQTGGDSYKPIETLIRYYPRLHMVGIVRPDDGAEAQQRLWSLGATLLVRPFTIQDILACTHSPIAHKERRSVVYEHA